ncbi:MAG TPA: aminotransferase class V-fold PLP-dependent enzyme [Candidatus Limnocylindria bacterium]|nr:aminotransferase class V-fold PLP-dependent enzyme [Candidatus Limnocylindria bacterium]
MSDDGGFEEILDGFYPYRKTTRSYRQVPSEPVDRAAILSEITDLAHREDAQGDLGTVSGSLYCGDHDHYGFLTEVFGLYAHANVLQRDMYPSATKFEGEIIAMTSDLLHGTGVGVVTSGGSESLITALYSYRERARETQGVTRPNLVMPRTAHVALDKGAHWMGIEVRHSPLTDGYVADVAAMHDLVDDQTIALVGSAANYAHGLIDPIEEIAALAQEHGLGLHVDGCLGGWLLPWVERLGYDVPLWDFRVPGVTSISADTHKYGYALKGSSVLLYRDKELRKHQYFTAPDWPGGLYLSPGLAGSRSGGVIASTWAALLATGESGYLAHADAIMSTAVTIREGIRAQVPELEVIGDPTFLVSFKAAAGSDLDIYLVNDALKDLGWRMNSLQLPPALHFCITRPNTGDGLAERFLADLRSAVAFAVAHQGEAAKSGAMYGFGGTPQGNATLEAVMSGVLDAMHEVAPDLPVG